MKNQDGELIDKWLNQNCTLIPAFPTQRSFLYKNFIEWAVHHGYQTNLTANKLTRTLRMKGFTPSIDLRGKPVICGIKLK